MLTKALLKYSIRKKQVYPKFVDTHSKPLLEEANSLIKAYKKAEGGTVSELQEAVSPIVGSKGSLLEGLNKLLDGRISSQLEGNSDDVLQYRWNSVLEAQKLRQEKIFNSLEEFQETLELRLGDSLSEIQNKLYSDLPECQKVEKFESLSSEALLQRYNTALVQGLLIHAHTVRITLKEDYGKKEDHLATRRFLFRQIKFHRLLCEVTQDKGGVFSFQLSGPLSLFQQRQTYGLRFANFFPYVLTASSWCLEADLELKGNHVHLKLDDTSGLKCHYSKTDPYIPKELLFFIESFNKKRSLWQASSSSHFLNLGKKTYCFPDIELKREDGSKVYLELFHRWHFAQLQSRLLALANNAKAPLILGVCKQIAERKEIKEALRGSPVSKNIFYFNEFPTTGKLLSYLNQTA